ncbi:MAG: putative Ig domain-containing protein, partial [Planctomycetia bacterium]
MTPPFFGFFGSFGRSVPRPGDRPAGRRLQLELLEDRSVPAFGPAGVEFHVNTFTTNLQGQPSVAIDADGDFVVAWTSFGQDGSNTGIYAQRYVDDSPPTLADPGARTVNEGTPLAFTLLGADPDSGDALVYSISAGFLPGMTLNPTTGDFTWTPAENQDGDAIVTFRVSDGALFAERTITITVGEVNVAPVLDPIGPQSVDELAPLTFTATATDADLVGGGPQTLTFSLVGAPVGASITPAGVFTWTPTEDQGPGSYIFDVVVSDGATTDVETITVTVGEVNVAPVLDPIDAKTIAEFQALTFAVTATDADRPANALSYSLVGDVPAGASLTSAGLFTWTPAGDQGGRSYTFTVRVSDGALTDETTFTVTVDDVVVPPPATLTLTPPTLSAVAAVSGLEDAPIPLTIGVQPGAGSPADAVLTVEAAGVPAGARFSAGVDLGGGVWRF